MPQNRLRASELVENHLTDRDICRLLGINQKSLNNKICRGDSLPKHLKLPGGRNRIWPTDEVDRWLNECWNDV